MRKHLMSIAAAALLAAGTAQAETTFTIGGVSDYDFRGISQSEGDPAIQVSLDWAGDLFYLGAWASEVDFGDDVDGDIELDLILGLGQEFESGWRWDAGLTWYLYPGSNESDSESESPDYWEIYAGGGWGPVDLRYWYSPDLYDSDETASYLDLSLSFELPWELGLGVHGGYSFGDYFDSLESPGGDDADYIDYAVSLARSFGRFDFEVKFVATRTDDEFEINSGAFRNDERFLLSVFTTFPWADEEAAE
jgi:uncharacterized protein (TIGR02001 family)